KFMVRISGFKAIDVDKNNKFYSNDGNCLIEKKTKTLMAGSNNAIIPDDGSVTSIGMYAFCNCNFKKITIPYGVTEIKDGTFNNCGNLEEVILPETLTTIGWLAFCGCKKLKKIILPKTVSQIADGAFVDWRGKIITSNNEKYYFKDKCLIDTKSKKLIACCGGSMIPHNRNIEVLGFRAYYNNRYLIDVVIPNGIYSVGRNVFESCKNLRSVVFSDSVVEIGGFVFKYCDKLEKVVLGENVSEIGENAFGVTDEGHSPKLKEVIFKNPTKWSVIFHIGKELIMQAIPEEILSNPATAARFIIQQSKVFERRVVFKRN
ncbi:MAG: leucine-rich repeat domain-containing protein, partial [Lachnospiraceae bacterium]|nr:leucine-rich repeat domain-containing protein [Lachnospiraceae bacterium]